MDIRQRDKPVKPVKTWRVEIHYPDGTVEQPTEYSGLTWNTAMALALAEDPRMSDMCQYAPNVEEVTIGRKSRVVASIYGGG
jgi:hypothetical protein